MEAPEVEAMAAAEVVVAGMGAGRAVEVAKAEGATAEAQCPDR